MRHSAGMAFALFVLAAVGCHHGQHHGCLDCGHHSPWGKPPAYVDCGHESCGCGGHHGEVHHADVYYEGPATHHTADYHGPVHHGHGHAADCGCDTCGHGLGWGDWGGCAPCGDFGGCNFLGDLCGWMGWGCGPKYWGDYHDCPPTCDPCDCCGNYVGYQSGYSPYGGVYGEDFIHGDVEIIESPTPASGYETAPAPRAETPARPNPPQSWRERTPATPMSYRSR